MHSALQPQVFPPAVVAASSPVWLSDRWRAVLGRRQARGVGP